MKKSVLMFSLLSGTALMFPRLTIASGLPAHTHTYTPEPKPAFLFEQPDKAYKTASVCFLGSANCGDAGFGSMGGDNGYKVDTSNQCLNEGFSKQNCNSVQTIDGVCPYNSAYGLGCKCASNLVSCPAGQVGVGEACNGQYASCQCDPALVACSSKEVGQGASCGGRYESCVCKDMYLYNSSNCSYPRSVSGDSCGGKYTDCVCPTGVDEGQYGCAEYYPSPCSSVCKVAYSDNCHIRSDDPNIALGYGCMKYYDDCSSKCERAYTDMCRERTAVISSCPDNADCSYFSDCSSKISSWYCNSGYKQEGSSCVSSRPSCNIGDIFYTDNTCSANVVSGKTVLGIVVYNNNGGVGGQIMAPAPIGKSSFGGFGTGGKETPESDTQTNSCELTAALNAKSPDPDFAPIHPAARIASNYAPTTATKGKWCLPGSGILKNIEKNFNSIQNSFSAINQSFSDGVIVSASIYGTDYAWGLNLSYKMLVNTLNKNNSFYVQPILEF